MPKKFKLFATGYFFCYLIYLFCFDFTFLAIPTKLQGLFSFFLQKIESL